MESRLLFCMKTRINGSKWKQILRRRNGENLQHDTAMHNGSWKVIEELMIVPKNIVRVG